MQIPIMSILEMVDHKMFIVTVFLSYTDDFLVSLIRMSMPFNVNLSTKSDDVKKWKENSVSEYQ